jgi:hypothetical protein
MQDFEDFVERDAVSGPDGKPLQKAALCTKCGQIKPLQAFKRTLSRAQSQARGHAGAIRLVIDSDLCTDCQPRKRGLAELSRKDIQNLVATGDLRAPMAKALLEKRDKELSKKRHHELSLQWKRAATATWGNILGDARTELARVQQQEKYVKAKRPGLPLDFFHEYKSAIARAREDLKFTVNVKGQKPAHPDWQAYVPADVRTRIIELWEELPLNFRASVKEPAILYWDFQKSVAVPARSLKKEPTLSPAERLAQGKNRDGEREISPDAEQSLPATPTAPAAPWWDEDLS